jgi:hypothetical protein
VPGRGITVLFACSPAGDRQRRPRGSGHVSRRAIDVLLGGYLAGTAIERRIPATIRDSST